MGPMKFQDDDQRRRKEMNGPRPSPLKISKDSHLINKPSSLHLSKPPPPAPAPAPATNHHHPVIIYTHSPKIIHAQARDFMALVQKLTGLSSSSSSDSSNINAPSQPPQDRDRVLRRPSSREDNESSSVLTDEHCSGGDAQGISSSWVSPTQLNANPHPHLADIPLFTPNSGTDYFCSPRHLYRYSDQPAFSSPRSMTANSLSPSVLDFMKGLPDY